MRASEAVILPAGALYHRQQTYPMVCSMLFPVRINYLTGTLEISYNFKYVGLHRRSSLKDPYSIRQIGVHQRYDAAADVSTWILVHPPDELWALFSSTLSTPHLRPADQFRCHAVIFRCLLSGYRDCINTVEENMRGLVSAKINWVKSQYLQHYRWTKVTWPILHGQVGVIEMVQSTLNLPTYGNCRYSKTGCKNYCTRLPLI